MFKITAQGQTLISIIFISVIGITIALGAAMMTIINSQSGLKSQQGEIAYAIAQSGADNALLRILRDPEYPGELGMIVDGGTVDIEVSKPNLNIVATSSGKIGRFIRKIQVTAHYTTDYQLVIDSRKEIF